jgi:hypothetical protein
MLGHVTIGCIQIRFITAGPSHRCTEIIGDQDLDDSLKELKGMNVGSNPGGKVLGRCGFGKSVITGSQSCHKDLSFLDLSGFRIDDLHRLSSIVNEEFFSGSIVLVEAGIKLFGPSTVMVAKLSVLVPFRILLLVFIPEKLKGDPFLL